MNAFDQSMISYFESLGAMFPEKVTATSYALTWNVSLNPHEHGFDVSLKDLNKDKTVSLEYTINKGLDFGTVTDTVKNILTNCPYYSNR